MTLFSGYSSIASATTLSTSGAAMQPRLFLLSPRIVFAGQVVVLDPPDYPVSYFAYGSISAGTFEDVKPGMTVIMGTSLHGDDLGRQRVKSATTISIFIGRSSQGTHDGEITLVDNAYFEIWDDRRVWAKIPFIDDGGESFKDGDLEVLDRTEFPPPVANMLAGYASTIDPDTGVITVLHNGQGSYATAAGATITDWLWNIGDGILIAGTLTSDNITVTYPAGFRFVSLTVTDSNGKTAITERPVYARDPDADTSFDGFDIEPVTVTDAGVRVTIRAIEDMPRATYPDGTLAMIWLHDNAGTAERTQMLITGWLDTEDATIGAGRNGLLRDTTLTILDVAARLDQLPGFPQSIADDETRDTDKIPDITWNYMVSPTMDLYMHYLWAWHSTALEVADFIWSGTGTAYQVAIKNSDGDSLWNQAWRIAQAMCPGFVLTCDQAGAIRVVPDPQLQDLADRTSVVQAGIVEDAYSDLRFGYQRAPRIHWLRTGALVVQSSISFNAPVGGAAPTVFLPTVFSIAPGTTPGQGLGESENNEQLAASQAVLNSATGHKYARLNAATGLLNVTLIQDEAVHTQTAWREIEPALKEWVTINLDAQYAAQRGLTFTTARALPKEISIRYSTGKSGLLRTVELTLELETSGQPAKTVLKPVDVPAVGEDPPVVPPAIPPPDDGLVGGQDLVAGIGQFGLYRTFDFTTPSGSGGPTWEYVDLTGSDEILTWVVDPFSPGYAPGATSGAINGYLASANVVYRVNDIFGTVLVNVIGEFDDVALWRTVQASFGTYFVTGSNPWLICISYYGSTGGHTGTWCTYSKDGGATWSAEVLVSSFYDSGGASNPIGLYCSPKTPGLAYTVAHIATANPATTGGRITTDWGEHWTPMDASDPAHPMPRWGTISGGAADYSLGGLSSSANLTSIAHDEDGGAPVVSDRYLILAPPKTTKRLVVVGTWIATHSSPSGGSCFSSMSLADEATIARTDDFGFTSPPATADATTFGSFTAEYTFTGGDWPTNADSVVSSPPTLPHGVRFRCYSSVTGSGANPVTCTTRFDVRVTEIELDSGEIYAPAEGTIVPVHGQGGTIHIPWLDDSESLYYYGALDRSSGAVYSLMRADEDISPSAGYGINHASFAVRAHDSDRQLVLAGVTNGTNQAVYKSSDAGDSWSAVISPAAGSVPYSAAWSGSLDDVLYIWGPAAYFGYSDDGGSSVDSRAGNLAALSATKLIGLAGGPTP